MKKITENITNAAWLKTNLNGILKNRLVRILLKEYEQPGWAHLVSDTNINKIFYEEKGVLLYSKTHSATFVGSIWEDIYLLESGNFLKVLCDGYEADYTDTHPYDELIHFETDIKLLNYQELDDYKNQILEKIKTLPEVIGGKHLFQSIEPPPPLIKAVNLVNEELIKYIKRNPKEIHNIRPRQFEELVANILSFYGWEVELTPYTKDGGYDIYAINQDISGLKSSWIIECKKYKSERKVNVEIVRGLWGVKNQKNAANALLATTSSFTRDAYRFKESVLNLELKGYKDIMKWIVEYKSNNQS